MSSNISDNSDKKNIDSLDKKIECEIVGDIDQEMYNNYKSETHTYNKNPLKDEVKVKKNTRKFIVRNISTDSK
tara:strand:+ start:10007 stop:10225 length:219 start_codon:yes stop_codon:yes gene_type:complete